MSRSHWESLLPFCRSEAQERNVKAILEHGSIVNAAKALGLNRRTVGKSIKIVEKYAASQGISVDRDLTRQTAEGFYAKRISTAYKDDGSVALQWVIQEPEKRSIEEKINALFTRFVNFSTASIITLVAIFTSQSESSNFVSLSANMPK